MFYLLHRLAINAARKFAADNAEMLRNNARHEAYNKYFQTRYTRYKEGNKMVNEMIKAVSDVKKQVVKLRNEAIEFNKKVEEQKINIHEYETKICELKKQLRKLDEMRQQKEQQEYNALSDKQKELLLLAKQQYHQKINDIKAGIITGAEDVKSC